MVSYVQIAREFMCKRVDREADEGGYQVTPGNVVRLYRMRPACQDAGYCLALTRELDCRLYPVRSGWCRERVLGR